MTKLRHIALALAMAASTALPVSAIASGASATTPDELNRDAAQALQNLYKVNPVAADIARHAKGILVFPSIVKAGLIFGGAYGEGVLTVGQTPVVDSYYNSIAASWGLQAGAQSYGYAVFLLTNKALRYIHQSHGWEIGTGPTVVIVNEGAAKNLTSTTLRGDAYAFVFDQQGLMASLSIEGTKISRIKR